jgi:hypothetical protein
MNALQKNQNFEEKMRNRIRDSIGDLIDDETLSKLINDSLHKTFFEPRIEREGSYNRATEYKEPLINDILTELLEESVNNIVKEYVKNNHDEIMNHVKLIIDDGVGMSVIRAFKNSFASEARNFQYEVENKLNTIINS